MDQSAQVTAEPRQASSESVWQTVVWDDPVNLMSYVTYVFQTHFGFSHYRAETLMLRVHYMGSCVVAEGSRTQMEAHVEAMHDYGLWATLVHETHGGNEL